MSFVTIPVPAIPNPSFSAVLDGQLARIALTTTDYGLFATIVYNGVTVATGRLCLDRTDINAARYLGMPQALFFADLQGDSDPVYTGFSTRYVLVYGDPAVTPETTNLAVIVEP